MKRYLYLLLATLHLSCHQEHPQKKELRGVWIASVQNIDWPKAQGENPEKQKDDFLKLLDYCESLNLNVVFVQVRTAGDALYPSNQSPFSRWLSGKEGYNSWKDEDPLEFMIQATHERGLEFHAWFNPLRATTNLDTTLLAREHIFFKNPDWIVRYGSRYYLNPGIDEVRSHISDIVAEVVNSYDIDGVHFDDYFYPYKIENEVFDDSLVFKKNARNLKLADWRRSNIDSLIYQVRKSINKTKPGLKFGVSPFGVWRNKEDSPHGSATEALQTTYDDLYADPLKWARESWVDYLIPQLYWSMDFPPASYKVLSKWWSENTEGADLYFGIGAYKVNNNSDESWYDPKQIPKQLSLNRKHHEIKGEVFFSLTSLMSNPDLTGQIRNDFYTQKALPFEKE